MKNRFGLSDADMEAIITILSKHQKVKSAIIFGSRSKGNYNSGSDVDIALKGAHLDFDTLNRISYWLNEETTMPYKFDVLNYNSIEEQALKEHIDRSGIEFYSNSPES